MSPQAHPCPDLVPAPSDWMESVLSRDRRVLVAGPPGSGKSTLASSLAEALTAAGRGCWCIGADPGSPRFGVPGAACLGSWRDGGWELAGIEALCTLDAGRFRLPLVSAVRRLASAAGPGVLLVDGPGITRGVAGAELLAGLAEAARVEAALVLVPEGAEPPLAEDLQALRVPVFRVPPAGAARRPSRPARARERTRLWDRYLAGGAVRRVQPGRVRLLGTAPPLDAPAAWAGRQVALLEGGRTLAMGEALGLEGGCLSIRVPAAGAGRGPAEAPFSTLLVRDAARLACGRLGTAAPFNTGRAGYLPPPDIAPYAPAGDGGPRFAGRVGSADVVMVNGVFGDPLIHLRLRHQRRSLLFDLGEGSRLPARVAHQVTDVFLSHAHIDHIGGFLWLLRSRIGDHPPCRIFGPPGIAGNVEGLVRGILWDRVGDRGPRFEVTELHGERLQRFLVQGGRPGPHRAGEGPAPEGLLWQEPAFCLRAVPLYHVSTVLAYALQPSQQINVRKDRLLARGLAPGPWLGELKRNLLSGDREAMIVLPDGGSAAAGSLAEDLVRVTPGKRFVYATDLADTPENRRRLVGLARHAHTFICEASFREADAAQAEATAHLTTRACGEIAEAAGVARLVPFHFSRRYEGDVAAVYDEIAAATGRALLPEPLGEGGDG